MPKHAPGHSYPERIGPYRRRWAHTHKPETALRQARHFHQHTQAEAAALTGYGRATLARYEAGSLKIPKHAPYYPGHPDNVRWQRLQDYVADAVAGQAVLRPKPKKVKK